MHEETTEDAAFLGEHPGAGGLVPFCEHVEGVHENGEFAQLGAGWATIVFGWVGDATFAAERVFGEEFNVPGPLVAEGLL